MQNLVAFGQRWDGWWFELEIASCAYPARIARLDTGLADVDSDALTHSVVVKGGM